MTDSQLDLPAVKIVKSRKARKVQTRLFHPTNRANLLSILSSGLIRPREGYEKYYEDLLVYCPGRVILWYGAVPRNLEGILSPPDSGLFPVMLEINVGRLQGRDVPSLDAGMSVNSVELPAAINDTLCLAPETVIPLVSVTAIHFRTPEEVEDFLSRGFDNVEAESMELKVSPSLFQGPDIDLSLLKSRLASLPRGCLCDPNIFQRLDSAAGATAVLAKALPESMEWLEFISQILRTEDVSGPKEPRNSKYIPDWIYKVIPMILGGEPYVGRLPSAEAFLFSKAIAILRDLNMRDGFVPTDFIENIARFESGDTDLAKWEPEISKWKQKATAIARNEGGIPDLDDTRGIFFRALFLFILRQEPVRILKSDASQLMPGENVRAYASLLSGLFAGYSRLGVDIRPAGDAGKIFSAVVSEWCRKSGRCDFCSASGLDTAPGITRSQETPVLARLDLNLGGQPFVTRKVDSPDWVRKIYGLAEEEGMEVQYDFQSDIVACSRKEQIEPGRIVHIQPGRSAPGGVPTVRFFSRCAEKKKGGKKVGKELALVLLGKNGDPDLFCRYAVGSDMTTVTAISDQVLESMDRKTFLVHFEAVSDAARSYCALHPKPAEGKNGQ